ncbi:MAG: hypothetical protein WCR27_05950 [Eubacteriales bacterium]
MPWCPKCKTEYREEIQICSDCGSDLVEKLDVEEEYEDKEYIQYQYLFNCSGDQEADILESFLVGEGIGVLRKYPGSSDISKVIGGMTKLDVELYVDKERFLEAKDIVENIFNKDFKQDDEVEEEEQSYDEVSSSNFTIGKILIIVLLMGLIFAKLNSLF